MNQPVLKIGLVGATGRMGISIRGVLEETDDAALEIGIASESRADLDFKTSSHVEALRGTDVAIDFSTPQIALDAARICSARSIPLVTGTTGLTEEQQDELNTLAETIPIVRADNFSVGVNVLQHLVGLAARSLPGWDPEIFEAHHRHKVDAPSGTALFLGEAIVEAQSQGSFEERATRCREGQTGPRDDHEIGFQVLRGGSTVGEHTVYFLTDGERIELTHRALDRSIFARGALRAARWIQHRDAGLYDMRNVLFDE